MICSDDEKVAVTQFRQDRAESVVKLVHGSGVTRDVVPVSVFHVEVDEICKTKTVKIPVHHLNYLRDAFGVA